MVALKIKNIMTIEEKVNEYIGHSEKWDEGFCDGIRREAYTDGYRDALSKVYEWLRKKNRGQMIGSLDRFLEGNEDRH